MVTRSTQPSLIELDDREVAEVSDERLVSCFLGELFYVSEKRNAYHGNLSENHWGVFSRSIEKAKRGAESRRKPGSHFTIHELPTLVFLGPKTALLVAQVISDAPLARCPHIKDPLATLRQVAGFFRTGPGIVVRLVSHERDWPPAWLPFNSYDSTAHGAKNPLRWHARRSDVNLEGIQRVQSEVVEALQRA